MAETLQWMSDEEFSRVSHATLDGDPMISKGAIFHLREELRSMRAAFRPGVAYMPVPRCDGCRHWAAGGLQYGRRGLQVGLCGHPDIANQVLIEFNACDVNTREDFGCVRWEAKPE